MELLGPLVHLHFSLQSVAILGDNAELLVTQIFRVVGFSTDVHQAVVVILIWLVVVHGDARLSRPLDELSERDSLLLVLPEEHLGERDQEEANHHQGDAMRIVYLVGWHIACIFDLDLRLCKRLNLLLIILRCC